MTDHPVNDDNIADLFTLTPDFSDADAFEDLVMKSLHRKVWLRRGLLLLAGLAGLVIAGVQLIRMPWRLSNVATEGGQTVRGAWAFMQFIDNGIATTMGLPEHYVSTGQTPIFFLLSFSLCLAILGLYYAYSTEETL